MILIMPIKVIKEKVGFPFLSGLADGDSYYCGLNADGSLCSDGPEGSQQTIPFSTHRQDEWTTLADQNGLDM